MGYTVVVRSARPKMNSAADVLFENDLVLGCGNPDADGGVDRPELRGTSTSTARCTRATHPPPTRRPVSTSSSRWTIHGRTSTPIIATAMESPAGHPRAAYSYGTSWRKAGALLRAGSDRGTLTGTFGWTKVTRADRAPSGARRMRLLLGLLSVTGRLLLDEIAVNCATEGD